MSSSGWFKLSAVRPGSPPGIMFGPCRFPNQRCALYADRRYKANSTVIWVPALKVSVGVASYVDAHRNGDEEALRKLDGFGIPRGVDFGYGRGEDLSSAYRVERPGAKAGKKKADSVSVVRAAFPSTFEDGAAFKAGDVVKIAFRKKFVGNDATGRRRFENAYYRPTDEELKEFLRDEAKPKAS